MQALTLTQPWAALVAHNHKRIETRPWSWNPDEPTRFAIHAAQGLKPIGGRNALDTILGREPFVSLLAGVELHFGAIVATATLTGCLKTRYLWDQLAHKPDFVPGRYEDALGDYTPGRYAWLLADITRLDEPIPCSGARGLWHLPEGVEARLP